MVENAKSQKLLVMFHTHPMRHQNERSALQSEESSSSELLLFEKGVKGRQSTCEEANDTNLLGEGWIFQKSSKRGKHSSKPSCSE